MGENCSHHQLLSGPLPRFEDSGTAGEIQSRKEGRMLGSSGVAEGPEPDAPIS